jgi:hypothetical protein
MKEANMQTQAIQQAIDSIESAADKAVAGLKKGQVSAELEQSVQQLHQQARSKRSLDDPAQLQQAVMEIEQTADRAVAACRQAGQVDPSLQQAIQDAHQQASKLKRELQVQG